MKKSTSARKKIEANLTFDPGLYPKQEAVCIHHPAKFLAVHKGRRVGMTFGEMVANIDHMLKYGSPVLWVDTTDLMANLYVEKYALPILRSFPKSIWQWREQKKQLRVGRGVMDIRSQERPHNIEGMGYRKITINEAGIVLRNRKLWDDTILPMMADYDDAVCHLVGTPKGKKVVGSFGARQKQEYGHKNHLWYELCQKYADGKDPDWGVINMSIYDNPHLSQRQIERIIENTAPHLRPQIIDGEFVDDAADAILKRNYWILTKELPMDYAFAFQSWDTAFEDDEENDLSACGTYLWAPPKGLYLIDVWAGRVEYPDLISQAKLLYNKWRGLGVSFVLIEKKASGHSMLQTLRRDTNLPVKEVEVQKSKQKRAVEISGFCEAGNVYLKEADWNSDFIDTCELFPNDEHDDIVDQFTQAVKFVMHGNVREPRAGVY